MLELTDLASSCMPFSCRAFMYINLPLCINNNYAPMFVGMYITIPYLKKTIVQICSSLIISNLIPNSSACVNLENE